VNETRSIVLPLPVAEKGRMIDPQPRHWRAAREWQLRQGV
jgi:hypothetical protein